MGSENGRVDVDINHAVWESLQTSGHWDEGLAIRRLMDIGLTELRGPRYNYDEVEIHYVAEDPMFSGSAKTGFYQALNLYKTKNRLPHRIRLEFRRPQTRNRRDHEVGE